jgi:hypothetical protein
MTILEAVGTYLQQNSFGNLGQNIFLSMMPESPDACIAVLEYQGLTPMFTQGAGGIQVDRPSLQLQVRAGRDDYVAARDQANNARILLSQVANQTIDGLRILRIEPSGSILPVGVDDNHRPLVTVNFNCFTEI